MFADRLILLLLEFHTVVTSLPPTDEVFTSPIANRVKNYHIANRAIYAGDVDPGTAALDIKESPVDLQHVEPIKKNNGWRVTGAILKSRRKGQSLKASRKCVKYSYPESVELPEIPVVKRVPCGNEAQDDKRPTDQWSKIDGSKEDAISVYHLPVEVKSSEEGLTMYNDEDEAQDDKPPTDQWSRTDGNKEDAVSVYRLPIEDKSDEGLTMYNVEDDKRPTDQWIRIDGNKEDAISVYHLPVEVKSSEEGLTMYNDEDEAQDDKRPTDQWRRTDGSSKEDATSDYRLPIEDKSDEGLTIFNEEDDSLTDAIASTKSSRHRRSPVKVSEYPSTEFSREIYRRVFEWIGLPDAFATNDDTDSEKDNIFTIDDAKPTDVKA